jgi:predicted nuclease with TOPRIM domain
MQSTYMVCCTIDVHGIIWYSALVSDRTLRAMQQVSAITRKRLTTKAVERLEESQQLLAALRDSLSQLQRHSTHCDLLVEDEQQKNADLLKSVQRVKQDKEHLLGRIDELEKELTTLDIRCHDLTRKVWCYDIRVAKSTCTAMHCAVWSVSSSYVA